MAQLPTFNNKQEIKPKAFYLLLVFALSYALLFNGGLHLFDWDEINFAECAREMIVNNNFGRVTIAFQAFWEKPPVFIWLQAISMQIFGINEFAARFPNAISSVLVLLTLFSIGKKLVNAQFGYWAALSYLGGILPAFYFKSGIIDPYFNLFIFLNIAFLYLASIEEVLKKQWLMAALAGVFLGLAVLTKGPAAVLITGLTAVFAWGIIWKFRFPLHWLSVLFYLFSFVLIGGSWFIVDYVQHGPWFTETFIAYQIRLFSIEDAGHGGFLGYHFVILLLGCFPISFFFLAAFKKSIPLTEKEKGFSTLMFILFWVVLILFSIIKTKIVHYSSLAYYPIAWGAATTIYRIVKGEWKLSKKILLPLWIVGSILALPPILFPILISYKSELIPLIKDKFAQANLEADVKFVGFEWTIGFFIIGVIALFLVLIKRNEQAKAFQTLLGGTTMYVFLIMVGFLGRAEMISQNAAIEGLKALQGKDVYIITKGYKSYAHLFYPQIQPEVAPPVPLDSTDAWHHNLMSLPNSKDVFVISKINRNEVMQNYPMMKEIWRKNGFVMYCKKASQ